ncbi:MAG: ATP-grasp domain-containing protein [Ardenticatenia bacterium]|nr:ATP-grasp domain-containing protein [Ardenticatenia bacterium]
MTLLRVGVVLGGRSSESEISLESGRNILANLDPSRFTGVPIYMDAAGRLWEIGLPHLVQNTTRDLEARLAHGALPLAFEDLPQRVDFVYIGLHGKYGEDGCFQGLLELLDLPYSGSGVLGAALGMDKRVQRRLLAQAGIDVPRTVAVAQEDWAADPAGRLAAAVAAVGFPAVVKPSREGCSTALAVVQDKAALAAAVGEALAWDRHALVEEHLSGTEVTVVVLEDEQGRPRAFAPTETPPKGDFLTIEEKFLPGQGMNITPARLPQETLAAVREAAERSFQALGLRVFARVDMYVTDDGRIVVGEPNTLPGSSPSSTIFLGPIEEGIGPMALVSLIIERSLAAHQAKKGPLD